MIITLRVICLILALVCALLAAFGVSAPRGNLIGGALAFLILSMLVV